MNDPIPCPFVHANGECCAGHIVEVQAFKADLRWAVGPGLGLTITFTVQKRATTLVRAAARIG
jgi:hypothetical protein